MRFSRWLAAAATAATLAAGASGLAAIPADAAGTCTTSAASGNCGPYSDPAVYTDVNGTDLVAQDVWNQIPGWSQSLTANGDNNWSVNANMPAGNGAVVSYPDTQVTYTLTNGQTPPMSNFGSALNSSWSNIDPSGSGLDYEYAYDIWLNPAGAQSWGNPQDQEIMIWTDNHGQTPAGNDTGKVYTDAAGTQWEIWVDSGSSSTSSSNDIVSFVRKANAQTGSLDLQGFFGFLKANGYTNQNAGVDQIDYGVEICSTGGVSKTFGLTGYTLTKDGTAPSPSPSPTQTSPSPDPSPSTPPPPPASAVAFDAKAGGKKTGTTPLSYVINVGSGANRALLIEDTVGTGNDVGCSQKVFVNGVALDPATEKLGVIHTNNQHAGFMAVWADISPPSGADTVQVTTSGCASPTVTSVAESFTGADQSLADYALASAFGSGASAHETITPAGAGDMVAAFAAAGNSLVAPSAPAANSLLENQNANTGAGNSAGSTLSSSGSFSQGLSGSDWWAAGLVDIHAA